MIADLKYGQFSHCKCTACGYFSTIDNFNGELVDIAKIESENGRMTISQLILKCPICTSEFTEALNIDELN